MSKSLEWSDGGGIPWRANLPPSVRPASLAAGGVPNAPLALHTKSGPLSVGDVIDIDISELIGLTKPAAVSQWQVSWKK